MKVLIYADIHHGVTIGKIGESGFDMRIEDTLIIEDKITDFCIDNNINTIFFLGDRFKSRNPSLWLVNQVDRKWEDRREKGIYTHALLGNHDSYRVTHYGTSYSTLWNKDSMLRLYDKPEVINFKNKRIGFLPYGRMLEDLKVDSVDILFFHDEIQGFKDDRGYKAPDWFGSNGLKLEELEKMCKMMIGGHIHSHIGIAGKGLYVGAPYQIDKLDIGRKRGIVVLDSDTLSIEFVEMCAPRLINLSVDNVSEIKENDVGGNYVTCYAKHGIEKDAEKLLKKYGAKSFIIHTIKERGFMIEKIADKIYRSDNPEDAIVEYVSSRNAVNKEFLVDMGLGLWKESEDLG